MVLGLIDTIGTLLRDTVGWMLLLNTTTPLSCESLLSSSRLAKQAECLPHTNTFLPYSYDRLGVGKSDTPDGLNVVQAPLEVEIAHQLIQMLRAGKFGHFSKVVGVGHSFGSIITQAITSQYPADLGMFFSSSSSSSSLSNLKRLTKSLK